MVTGWNLLNEASGLIPSVTVKYRKCNADAESNAFGIVAPPYGEEITVDKAHVQPMPSAMYAQLGLQPGRNARRVFLPADVNGMEVEYSGGDVLLFDNRIWKIHEVKDWYGYDGWKALAVVENKDYPTFAPVTSGAVTQNGL